MTDMTALDEIRQPLDKHPDPTTWPTAEAVIKGLFEENGLRASLVPTYTTAVLALGDHSAAARLRAAGHSAAAAFLEPNPEVIDEAFGIEDR